MNKVKLIDIEWDKEGKFILRENRFLGIVEIDGKKERVHIHDPGRLEELLYPGNRVLLKREYGKSRKTKWELIASRYGNFWVFTNSGYHRKISEKIVRSLFPDSEIVSEVQIGHSRLDFLVKNREITGVEVKGCTLTIEGKALFPDAPTERGRKHIKTLIEMMEMGNNALLLILIFRPDSICFSPNEGTDPEFASIYRKALEKGLEVRPMLLEYDGESILWRGEIELC